MEYKIKLKHFHIENFEFKAENLKKIENPNIKTDLRFKTAFKPDNTKEFLIIFDLRLLLDQSEDLSIDRSEKFLKLESKFYFETEQDFDEEFKESTFVKISAPAIAFPYLRTFISNFILNAGYQPIILPSINFVRMSEEN